MARTARATGQPFWAWVESCLTFGRHFLRADFAAARRTLAEAEEIGRAFGPDRGTDGPAGLQTFMIRRETGRLEQVRGLVSGEEDPGDRVGARAAGALLRTGSAKNPPVAHCIS